jgi:hypothetical protein
MRRAYEPRMRIAYALCLCAVPMRPALSPCLGDLNMRLTYAPT